ncbi:MAG: proline dehydrogenase [Planctomycetia bacterium]|nr:proline dehydrogenase [Planctomycetia bacterium]
MRLTTRARRAISKCLRPLARRAAGAYVAGEHLEDALEVADRLTDRGLGVTLGFWDGEEDSPRHIADTYLAGVKALAGRDHAYLSIKVPSLKFSEDLLAEVVGQAARSEVRLHFDALGPEVSDRSRALFDRLLDRGVDLSYTLPGRWMRSIEDAAWAAGRGFVVRVVKGQWADPADPRRDLRTGFLQVIDALAGRARHVAVASHDVPLVTEAVNRLRAAGTSCEMELLYGLPMRESLALADELKLGVHVYVPYGKAYLPYALAHMQSNPRIAWWLLRDMLKSRGSRKHTDARQRELVTR